MRRTDDDVVNNAIEVCRRRKVVMLSDVAALLRVSLRTARRKLKQWDAYRSYNNNGRYYALPQAPRFDKHGLWLYRGIGFSKYGNLSETVVHLVARSDAGLCAAELGELLGMQPYSFFSLFREHPALRREKHGGRFVYFSADEARYFEQRGERAQLVRDAELPGDTEAISILVAAIKHVGLSVEGLSRKVEKEGIVTTPQRISNLLAKHGLTLKKRRLRPDTLSL